MAGPGNDPFAELPEDMREKLRQAQALIKSSSFMSAPKIGVKQGGGKFRFPDETELSSFSGVIIQMKHANKNYPKAYVAGQVSPADCVATTKDGDAPNQDLVSLAKSTNRYATHCGSCSRLEWGSNKTGSGKGKLCTEYVVLAIWVPGRDELFVLEEKKARATQVDNYIASVTANYGLPLRVLTEFSIGVVDGQPFSQSFTVADIYNDAAVISDFANKMQGAEEMLYNSVVGSLEVPTEKEQKATKDEAGDSGRAPRKRK